jgi:7-cyano-7-deazaguanine reductase
MSHTPPIEAKVLGKQVDYPQQYTPEILVAVPRSINRKNYNIEDDALPFLGIDVWHAYELSFLTNTGLPVTGVLKLLYPASTPFLVESKSLKLYLNGFNMGRYGKNATEGIEQVLNTIRHDLSALLNTNVNAAFFSTHQKQLATDFNDYILLEEMEGVDSINFTNYTETPSLLVAEESDQIQLKVGTHLLRSNCKITHQPDWGSAFIYIKSNKLPKKTNLLQYLVSIRNENHFHEEICEMIYKRLWDNFNPEELMVACIYTRRGGIDICPVRASHEMLFPGLLCNLMELSPKLVRQ